MRNKAFTLLELLVVIVIIGIGLSLIMPALGKARENARRAMCVSNLRQIGMAMHMYIDDYNFKFPPLTDASGYWYNIIQPYVTDINVWKCPDYKDYDASSFACQSYGYNRHLVNEDITAVKSTSKCMLVTDSGPPSSWAVEKEGGRCDIMKTSMLSTPGDRHSGGVNILFVDGHVAWYKQTSIPFTGVESDLWWNWPP